MSEYVSYPMIDWETDPIVVAQHLEGLADALDRDLDEPAIASRQVIQDDIREHFEREEAATGERWEPWAPSYRERAERENIGILRKTEDLYDAVTDISSWPVIGHDVWMNTATWPDYWSVHQRGALISSGSMKARRARKIREKEEGARGHGRIPARPFLGLSEDAVLVIDAIYNGWVEGKLRVIVDPLFGIARYRTVRGTVGPRIGIRRPRR